MFSLRRKHASVSLLRRLRDRGRVRRKFIRNGGLLYHEHTLLYILIFIGHRVNTAAIFLTSERTHDELTVDCNNFLRNYKHYHQGSRLQALKNLIICFEKW